MEHTKDIQIEKNGLITPIQVISLPILQPTMMVICLVLQDFAVSIGSTVQQISLST